MIICFSYETSRKRYHTFLKLLVVWYLFDSVLLLPHYDQVYGNKSIYRLGYDSINWFVQLTSFLREYHFDGDAYIFIFLQFILGSLILFKSGINKFHHIIFYIVSTILQYPLMYGLDGGNNLAQILYLYFIIFDWSHLKKAPFLFKKSFLY